MTRRGPLHETAREPGVAESIAIGYAATATTPRSVAIGADTSFSAAGGGVILGPAPVPTCDGCFRPIGSAYDRVYVHRHGVERLFCPECHGPLGGPRERTWPARALVAIVAAWLAWLYYALSVRGIL